ncbi:MAG: hypothetical protein KI786_03585 [Mameliella sp.]|nr:hypothetical protein [Phaeodactylibacter sp.]
MQDAPNSGKPKPEWLERLEQESYQAELIVSGVALLGAMQLPGLIDSLLDWCLQRTTTEQQWLLGYIFVYLSCGAFLLLFNFVLHFTLRTLWIGNIGLASVFPNGINKDSERFSPHFLSRLKARFPDLQKYNQTLDDLCSLLFSIAGISVITFASIIFIIIVSWVLGYLLSLVIPGLSITIFAMVLFCVMFLFLLLNNAMHHKKMRDLPWVKKIQFPMYMVLIKILSGPFMEPFTYIGQTLATNVSRIRYMGITFGYIIVITISFMMWVEDSNLFYLRADIRHRVAGREHTQYATRYDNMRVEGVFIPFAMIDNDVIEGNVMKVFVPVPKIEREQIREYCGEDWESKDRKERRECLQSYYTFQIDNEEVQPSGLYLYEQKDTRQRGVRVYLPLAGQNNGEHHLQIVPARYEKDSFLINIPFQYFPRN